MHLHRIALSAALVLVLPSVLPAPAFAWQRAAQDAAPIESQEAPLASLSPETVLAPGDNFLRPLLTVERADQWAGLVEWAANGRMTPQEKQEFYTLLAGAWPQCKDGDPSTWIQGFKPLSLLRIRAATLPQIKAGIGAHAIPKYAFEIRSHWIKKLRALGDAPEARWQRKFYERVHAPLAPGKPPLTRQASDAWAEMLQFKLSLIGGAPPKPLDTAALDAIAKRLTAAYPGMTPPQQAAIASSEEVWVEVQNSWHYLDEGAREEQLALWGKAMESAYPQIRKASLARRTRLATARKKYKEAWDKMPTEMKLQVLQMQHQSRMSALQVMGDMSARHNENMNQLIWQMKSQPYYRHSNGNILKITPRYNAPDLVQVHRRDVRR